MDDDIRTWLIVGLCIIIFKGLLVTLCLAYRMKQRNELRKRLVNEEEEIQRMGQMSMNILNNRDQVYNNRDHVYTVAQNQNNLDDFEHVQEFEPPSYQQGHFEPPPSYWDTVNHQDTQIRPSVLHSNTRIN